MLVRQPPSRENTLSILSPHGSEKTGLQLEDRRTRELWCFLLTSSFSCLLFPLLARLPYVFLQRVTERKLFAPPSFSYSLAGVILPPPPPPPASPPIFRSPFERWATQPCSLLLLLHAVCRSASIHFTASVRVRACVCVRHRMFLFTTFSPPFLDLLRLFSDQ